MISVPGTINIAERQGRFGSFNVGTLECSIGSFTVKDSSIEEFDPGIYRGDFVIEKIKPISYLAGSRLVVEVRATLSAILLSGDAEPLPSYYETLERDPIEDDPEPTGFGDTQSVTPGARSGGFTGTHSKGFTGTHSKDSYKSRQSRPFNPPPHAAPDLPEFVPQPDPSPGSFCTGESPYTGDTSSFNANPDECDTAYLPDAANLFGVFWPIGRVVKLDPTIDRGLFRQQKDYLKNNGYRFMALEQNWVLGG